MSPDVVVASLSIVGWFFGLLLGTWRISSLARVPGFPWPGATILRLLLRVIRVLALPIALVTASAVAMSFIVGPGAFAGLAAGGVWLWGDWGLSVGAGVPARRGAGAD